jgi:hypothetical protein
MPVWSPPTLAELRRCSEDLFREGVMTPSPSSYSSPAFLNPKGEEEYRLVVDYRKLSRTSLWLLPFAYDRECFSAFLWCEVLQHLGHEQCVLPGPSQFQELHYPFRPTRILKLPISICIGGHVLSLEVERLFGTLSINFCLATLTICWFSLKHEIRSGI